MMGAVLVAVLGIVGLTTAPAMAANPAPAELGCDDNRVEYDLIGPGGNHRWDIGQLMVYEDQQPGYNQWCVITKSGDLTLGYDKHMSIMLAWHSPGVAPAWPMVEGSTYDAGTYRNFAGSAYSTGRADKCLAIKGFVVWKGETYSRTINNVYCYS